MYGSFETILSEELSLLGLEKLQPQQKLCLQKLVEGNDALAILPTGFGNSLIYQLFPRLLHCLRYPHIAQPSSTILVVAALTAIIDDQVKYSVMEDLELLPLTAKQTLKSLQKKRK